MQRAALSAPISSSLLCGDMKMMMTSSFQLHERFLFQYRASIVKSTSIIDAGVKFLHLASVDQEQFELVGKLRRFVL